MTDAADNSEPPVSDALLRRVVRLTRLARHAENEQLSQKYLAERSECLAGTGYRCRIREDSNDDVLVLHPREWLQDEAIDPQAIENIDRAFELSLSGGKQSREWEAIDAHNRSLVDAVTESHGSIHGANVAAFADFMGNHHAQRIETATDEEVQVFLEEYFPRNAWPSERQASVVEESLRRVFAVADRHPPPRLIDDADENDG